MKGQFMSNMQSPAHLSSHHIGFISTRFSGTDGVSLETQKWAHILERLGQNVYYFAGQSDLPEPISFVVPEALFYIKMFRRLLISPTGPLPVHRKSHIESMNCEAISRIVYMSSSRNLILNC